MEFTSRHVPSRFDRLPFQEGVRHIAAQIHIPKTRIDAACVAIEKTHQSLTAIAYSTGFNDHSYFTKVFIRIIGKTPIEYRRQARKKASH